MKQKIYILTSVLGVLMLAMVACQASDVADSVESDLAQPESTATAAPAIPDPPLTDEIETSAPTAPAPPPETIAIFDPKAGQPLSGGELQVSGYSEYFFESSLSMALCGAGGSGVLHPVCGTVDNVIAEGYAMIESPDIGQAGPFSGSLSYQIEQPVNATLVVYAQSARDGSLLHASSVVVGLNP